MKVLHGAWGPSSNFTGRFFFWAEGTSTPTGKLRIDRVKKPRKGKGAECPRYPYQLPGQDVLFILEFLWAPCEVNQRPPGEKSKDRFLKQPVIGWRKMLIPSRKWIPDCSTGIIEKDANRDSKIRPSLTPWKIQCVELDACDALLWLARLPGEGTGQFAGAVLGEDILFWSAAAKFTLELLVRQRFIPSAVETGTELVGKWFPIIDKSEDMQRLSILAESMPPVCRAELSAQTLAPRELVVDFINCATDGIIRKWIARRLTLNPSWKERLLTGDGLITIWFSGLTSCGNPRLLGTPHQLKTIRDSVNDWVANIQSSGQHRPWRLTFRLEEPADLSASGDGEISSETRDSNWRLTFHLQATDDKSLIVPAEELWRGKGGGKFITKKFEYPEELFLEDLEKASRLYQPIEQSLKTSTPTCCSLDARSARGFLKEASWLLEECGYGVLVPSWWTHKRQMAQLALKLKVYPPRQPAKAAGAGTGFFTLDSIVDFRWEIALGDETLTRDELRRLAQLKMPLVNVRGKWVEIDEAQIAAAMNFLDRGGRGELTLADVLHVGLGERDVGLPVIGFDAEGWLADLINGGEQGRFTLMDTPAGFQGELRPYQKRGFSWLAFLQQRGLGACLADDMGLGKTIQFIALALHSKSNSGSHKMYAPVLLICPTSVVGNWKHELERFAPSLRVMIHHGTERKTGKQFASQAMRQDIVISTYSLAYRDEADLGSIKWAGIVLDEAQNIKNPYTKQSQAIRRLSGGHKIALTGTPVENRLNELWSIMEFLNPGYLGSLKDFKSRFAVPIERYMDKTASGKLGRLIQPFILRRLKTDRSIIQDLPEKLEMKTFCTLTREQATLYQAVVDDMMAQIEASEDIKRRGLVLSALMKLKQVCNHPVLFLRDNSEIGERSGKMARFMEMLEEALSTGDRVLVFTQFVSMGEILRTELRARFGFEPMFLHGGVSRKARDEMVARFQGEHGAPVFILSLKAGGFGLNLTNANRVFHFDRWWNPAVENQATDRAFRIGQTRNVIVHKFVCMGTLEERIDQMLEHKKGLAESILGTGESWLTELSNEELRGIFTLRRDAVQGE